MMVSTNENTPWVKSYPAYLKWNQNIPVCAVADMLDKTVEGFGHAPGFDFLGKKMTWGEIGHQVNLMAKGLQGIGVSKGIKVGLFLPNSPTFVIAYYAVLKAGGTVVNFNPLYSVKEVAHQVEDSHADVMITLDVKMLCDKLMEVLPQSRIKKIVIGKFTDLLSFPKNILYPIFKAGDVAHVAPSDKIMHLADLMKNDGKPAPVPIDPVNDVAVLQYTGGTTGVPKGAMLTHANVVANVTQCYLYLNMLEKGQYRMLGVLPFFHVFAMTGVMNLSVLGAFEIIALPRFDLKQTLKLIDKAKPHIFPAVPAIYNAINNYKHLSKYDLRSIRLCVSGGAPLPVEVKKTFEKNTGCVVAEGYGLTESSPVICVNPPVGENRAGSIGLPMPGTMVEIVDPEDKKTRMKQGERGELCAKGPQVMKGYWNKDNDSADVLIDGFLHTGDVAIMDSDGYFFIVDRIKDMIITNGYKVYPRNVEEAIYQNPAVEECIVAGIPDVSRGEIVKAWVKPRDGQSLTEADLKAFLDSRISKMEMPRSIEIRDKPLPKTMIGKLSRKDILAEEKAKTAA
jgi:long-chain acyl-CoA synthetase